MSEKHFYWYIGPVTSFGKLLVNNWKASTYAKNSQEAKRNLLYRYKTTHNLLPGAKIELPGKIILGS